MFVKQIYVSLMGEVSKLLRAPKATDHLFFVERLAVLRRGTIGGATFTVRVEFEARTDESP